MFIAYYESPNELKSLIKRFADAQLESIRLLAEIGCDGVMGYDDWGLQSALMVKQELIEEFFAPYYQRNWAYAHLLGLDVWLHSCGYIIDLLPKFKAWGLDVIQMDQQENMGLEQLDAVIGGQLAFWCPVDIQKTMVNGSPDDIRAYVRKLRTTVGDHCGGMISMAYSTPTAVGHSAENLAAMCDEFRALPGY
jgi:uroporphyrinogen-III decarboxylase